MTNIMAQAERLLTFAALRCGQPVPELPNIKVMSLEALNCQIAGHPWAGIRAAYMHNPRECWVGYDQPANMEAALVHELTHYLQDLQGEMQHTRESVIANEIEAHQVQWDYMAQQGTLACSRWAKDFVKSRENIPAFVKEHYGRLMDRGDLKP